MAIEKTSEVESTIGQLVIGQYNNVRLKIFVIMVIFVTMATFVFFVMVTTAPCLFSL